MTDDQFSIIIIILTQIEIKIENLNRRLDNLTINNNRLVGSTEIVKKYFPLRIIEDVTNFEEQLKMQQLLRNFLFI